MKRRKFLQILGLMAAAPAAVLACPPVHKQRFYNGGIVKDSSNWKGNDMKWINYEFEVPVKIQEPKYYISEAIRSKLLANGIPLPENIACQNIMPPIT